jgi:hypothetical protein
MPSFAYKPAELDIEYYWGDNLRAFFQITDNDGVPLEGLEDGSLKMQIRVHPMATDALLEASTEDGTIAVSGHEVGLDLPTSDSNLGYAYVKLFYDIQFTDVTGAITTLIKGRVIPTPQTTLT